MIQGSINNLLNQAAIFGRLSPGYETKQELHKLGKQEKALEQKSALAEEKAKSPLQSVREAAERDQEDFAKQALDIEKRKFELKPSAEGYKKVLHERGALEGTLVETLPADEWDYLQEQAELKAESSLNREQKRVSNSRRNFMDYLGKQETSFGGTVSQLPPEMQKQIASQYSKSQRQSMMNRMDKEKKGQ